MELPVIKKGQVWQNRKGEKFYLKEVEKVDLGNNEYANSRVYFISLQNTEEYFAGEICSCSLEGFQYQTLNLKLIEENFNIDDKLKYQLKLDEIDKMIEQHKNKIKELQNRIVDLEKDRNDYVIELNKIMEVQIGNSN